NLFGSEAIDAVFQMRTEHIIEQYRRKVNGKTLEIRLDQVTQLREADGYMSSWEINRDGTYILREANCPIIHAAEECEGACNQDQIILEQLLDADILRKEHLASGDCACSYEVRPRQRLDN
ncbi:MAG: hypothetical protein R3264_13215, partial [Anaerolineae bacterium]|nr:hypothetical protein [Anaerolineae bacterium]